MSLAPKFSLDKSEKLFLGDKYLCNGHWLIKREYAATKFAPTALRGLCNMRLGCYYEGPRGTCDTETKLPNFDGLIPQRDGYRLLERNPIGVEFKSDEISCYIFAVTERFGEPTFRIGVNPKYVPLMRIGHTFAKDALSPLLVLQGDTLNDDLIGVVMPMRLEAGK